MSFGLGCLGTYLIFNLKSAERGTGGMVKAERAWPGFHLGKVILTNTSSRYQFYVQCCP